MEKEVIAVKMKEKSEIIFGTLEKELSKRFTGYAFVPENAKKEMKQAIAGAILSGYNLAQEAKNGKA